MDVPSLPDLDDEHQESAVINRINDMKVPDPDPELSRSA
ncbi:hypothetical protein ART_4077 [Arthrobacter sp. PAMC 25486]|nr:hypothetical protein ART_4077 [Arthrobacter sp. PAMC 25486]